MGHYIQIGMQLFLLLYCIGLSFHQSLTDTLLNHKHDSESDYHDEYSLDEYAINQEGGTCPDGMFQCTDKRKCIPEKWKCDFSPDCFDGSDELPDCHDMTTCQPGQFTCKQSKKCIPFGWVCDNEFDCGNSKYGLDQSDEEVQLCRKNITCSGNMYQCKDGLTCLHMSKFCDHKIDCPDNSDEGPQCKQIPSCKKTDCSNFCTVTWKGPKCYCPEGQEPDPEKPTICKDQDECMTTGNCDQLCNNTNGSFTCGCVIGYKLQEDKHTCRALNVPESEEPTIVFANSADIQRITIDGKPVSPNNKIVTHETLALDHIHRNRTICWISHGQSSHSNSNSNREIIGSADLKSNLSCAEIDNFSNKWSLPQPDVYSLNSINQMAIDWISMNFYFLDISRDLILLCSYKEHLPKLICKTILSIKLSRPRGIALDPNEGLMFFSVWGTDIAKLERANLDGGERFVLIDTKIVYAYGISIDYPNKHIYWVDTYLDFIERVDYTGSNRKTILRGSPVQNLYSLAVFENIIYVTSWRNNSILAVNKFHPENHTTILSDLRPFAISVFHRERQPILNFTEENKHPCSDTKRCDHICIPTKASPFFKCICKSGYELKSSPPLNGNCIKANRSEYLLYGQQKPGIVKGISIDASLNQTEVIIPMVDLVKPTAMDYDAKSNCLYLADSQWPKIEKHSLEGESKEVFLAKGLNNVMGLAVDWIGNNLYWTDEGLRGIFVTCLSNSSKVHRLLWKNLTHPRSIVVDPVRGIMYWSSWPPGLTNKDSSLFAMNPENGIIETAWMDGTKRSPFVELNVVWANGLTIDTSGGRLYWCDSFLQTLESVDIETGTNRVTHLSSDTHPGVISRPYGLGFHNDILFWTEFDKGQIMQMNLKTNSTSLIKEENPQLFSIKVFSRGNQPQLIGHTCEKAGCQDLCLLTPDGFTCVCRDGMMLDQDNMSCREIENWIPFSHCGENQFQCLRNQRCIDLRYICDGEDDCGDLSDEDLETTCRNSTCKEDQFRCDRTKCISSIWKCDGDRDCDDGSDESQEECSATFCAADKKFTCQVSGRCIPKSWLCDSDLDCGEGDTSDEGPDCQYPTCASIEFSCDNKRCIPLEHVCDGEDDCRDGSDETNCNRNCSQDHHSCDLNRDSGAKCLPKSKICDGTADCMDGSDELQCGEILATSSTCRDDEFRCEDSTCIPLKFLCDGSRDCMDASDESSSTCNGSVTCGPKERQCGVNQKCIPAVYWCDGDTDCENGADEINCPVNEKSCEYPSFQCDVALNKTKCLSVTKLCDGFADCKDFSDEGMRCFERVCTGAGNDCSDLCQNSPDGRRCHCPPGLHLDPNDKTTCTEDHPCDRWGTCSQQCKVVSRKRHKCFCHEGYFLQSDNFSCKSKDNFTSPLVVFSTRNELRSIDIHSRVIRPLVSGLKNTIAIDFFHTKEKDYVFWTDILDVKIYRGTLVGGTLSDVRPIVENGLTTAEGLAVDWIGGNLYWVESDLDQIEVARLNGSLRRTLISGDMSSPRAIALDPSEALLFWTDWENGSPRIESCDMSGNPASRKVVFVVTAYRNGAWPNGLTLDLDAKRMYWIDARSDSIHTATYDGKDHREILRGHQHLSHPFAITLYESFVYWTDWRSNAVLRADKWKAANVEVIDKVGVQPYDIHILHPSRQPKLSRTDDPKWNCKLDNGNCTHLCLISSNPNGFVCACPHAMKLSADGRSCETDDLVLVFTRPHEIRGVGLNHSNHHVIPPISLADVSKPVHLDFVANRREIYWSDEGFNHSRIMRSSLDGLVVETVLDSPVIGKSSAFGVDWLSGTIYFVSEMTEIIENMSPKTSNIYVSNLEGEYLRSIIDKNPGVIGGLVLAPNLGTMYWNDNDGDKETIKTAKMDGTRVDQIIELDSSGDDRKIVGLSYSASNRQLFWLNVKKSCIQYWDFRMRRLETLDILKNRFQDLTSMAVHNDQIYFSAGGALYKSGIDSLDENITLLINSSKSILSVKIYDPSVQEGTNACAKLNNGCSQLCLPSGLKRVCNCSIGFVLTDETHCAEDITRDFLIFTSRFGISAMDVKVSMENFVFSPVSRDFTPTSIESAPKSGLIFWIDGARGTMHRVNRDGSKRKKIFEDLHSPKRLAIDWISENIYWTDDEADVIEMADFDGRYRYKVVSTNLDEPFAIAVDPISGLMFWSDNAKIERSSLDGSNRIGLIFVEIVKSVTGLATDPQTKTLFWCDGEQGHIGSIPYDGGSGHKILEHQKYLSKPNGIAFFGGFLYWIDSGFNGGSISRIIASELTNPDKKKSDYLSSIDLVNFNLGPRTLKDLKIYTSSQTGSNPCAMNNAGCQELCAFNGKSAVCLCSHGKLGADLKSCESYDAFLIYSRVSKIESAHMFDDNNPNSPLPPISSDEFLRNAVGLAYDFETSRLYYSDIQRGSINSVNANGTDHTVLLENLGAIEGLSFEYQQRALYWTHATDRTISRIFLQEVSNKNLKTETIIRLNLEDRPRGIDIDSCEGRVYFTNWNPQEPKIQRAWLSGFGLETIVHSNIRMPNALTVDPNARKFYWADARLDKIERVDMDTFKRVILTLATPQHPFDMTVYGDFLFYTDWVLHAVIRINKFTGEDVTWLRRDVPRPMSLVAVGNDSHVCKKNPCDTLNGGCEDHCTIDERGKVVCQCYNVRVPIVGDGEERRCSQQSQQCTDPTEFQCGQGFIDEPICIPYNLTCDQIPHCPDKSDESTRYCALRTCKEGFFKCSNNRCVSFNAKCDGVDNCGDYSDEAGCPCSDESMFRCTQGPCISKEERCDLKPDCSDASDEMNCAIVNCSSVSKGSFINLFKLDEKDFQRLQNCANTTACILPEWICDGSNDCWDNSDEKNCALSKHHSDENCPDGFFKCANGNCIPITWRCDKEDDCKDSDLIHADGKSSDEIQCLYSCKDDQFKCASGDCIPTPWKCDGVPDCEDGSDELKVDCDNHECLHDKEFKCNSTGNCIPQAWVCDGDTDCQGGHDESSDICMGILRSCTQDEFRCLNNKCINKHLYCDLDDDCGDGSDEPEVCSHGTNRFCPQDFFRCSDGSSCVPFASLCDGNNNCKDGSDENENNCNLHLSTNNNFIHSLSSNSSSELSSHNGNSCNDLFTCKNGVCVPWDKLCDGPNDCGDYSDESSCNVNECENPYTCAHVCNDKKIGYECQCHKGFRIRPTNPSLCDDIDECEVERPCSQLCLNTPGSYKCACSRGYVAIDNGRSCKANSTEFLVNTKLLLTNRYYIKLIDLEGKSDTLIKDQINTVAIDFDWASNCIFWSDVTSKGSALRKACSLDESDGNLKVQQLATLQNPDGLAVDWVGRNLYWCDKGSDTIEVSNLNGEHRRILIREGLLEPRAIALDPQGGLLFWSDWGERPHIGRAHMDGTNSKIILESKLGWPNALAIDYATRQLFFGDAREDYIGSVDLDGSNLRVIISRGTHPYANLQHIFALTVFEDYIYWTDWETLSVEKCNKNNGKDNSTILRTIHRPMDVQVYHPLRQPMPAFNPCENNGGCDALCLLVPGSSPDHPNRVCQCPQNFALADNGLSCLSNCSASMFRCNSTLKCIPFWWKCDGQDDCGDNSDEPATCPPFTCTPGQFQCENSQCVYPTQICDRNDDCGDKSDEQNCDDYTCIGKQFKCQGNETMSGFCIDADRKCNHQVDCPGGEDELNCPPKMCPKNQFKCKNENCIPSVWVCDSDNDCGDNSDELEDCRSRKCSSSQFKCPNGRCIPLNWKCDGDIDCEGGEDEPPSCRDDSVKTCDQSYFRCNNNRCIPGRWRCDYDDDCGDNSDEVECINLYRNCSESELTCSDGMCLHESKFCDGRADCVDKTDELFCNLTCSEEEFRCRSPPYCIFSTWKCDGERDCSDGSDEEDCPESQCASGEFTCNSTGSCIITQWLCDGEVDCADESDESEETCRNRSCDPSRHRCDNHRCVVWTSLCDGIDDCTDGSDESPNACQAKGECQNGFRCANGRCLQDKSKFVCDGHDNCGDGSDELDCSHPPCSFGACSQKCDVKHIRKESSSQTVNTQRTISTSSCSCVTGYSLEAKKTCKAMGSNATLILANENVLRHITPYAFHRMVELHPNSNQGSKIESLDVFYIDDDPVIIWSVKEDGAIYFQKGANESGLLANGFVAPMGLSTDWIARNIYLIHGNKGDKKITIVNFQTRLQKDLPIQDLEDPQDIAVDPESGKMFISDAGPNAKIWSCHLDGGEPNHFVVSKVIWPSGLSLDYPGRRLYWTDLKTRTIETIEISGRQRTIVKQFHPKEGKPFKVEVFENYIYYSTYQHNKIMKLNKFGRGNVTEIAEEVTRVSDLSMMQEYKQDSTLYNPCSNAQCKNDSTICVIVPGNEGGQTVTHRCLCAEEFEGDNCTTSKTSKPAVITKKSEAQNLTCEDVKCRNGICKIVDGGTPKCKCEPLFKGDLCDTYICADHCLNGGICFPHWPMALTDRRSQPLLKCGCREGFEGEKCEIDSTTCENRCSVHARCVVSSDSKASCLCESGYSGDRCEGCSTDDVCLNGGTCHTSTAICMCPVGYFGPFCQFSQCDNYGSCLNGGTCLTTAKGPKCKCAPGFAGQYCETYSCDKVCLNGGTPEDTPAPDGGCICDCPPGTGGRRCEKTGCSPTTSCHNDGVCVLLDGKDVCNCSAKFYGPSCKFQVSDDQINPCMDMHCHNGGVCQVILISKGNKKSLFGKCLCPKHRAGKNCEKPNLCLDRCLNGGICRWSTDNSGVSCICRRGFKGERCQARDSGIDKHLNGQQKHLDTEEVSSDVIKIVASIVGVILTLAGIFIGASVCRRRRLSEAFKHRRMAESLVNGGASNHEVPNQMYLLEHTESEHGRLDGATNFVNPVYETMFSPEDGDHEENSGLLSLDDHDHDDLIDHAESESADLLTEKHRGNISL